MLAAVGAQPFGGDLSVGCCPIARLTARRMAGDAQALPLRDEAFDAVAAVFSLNRVPNPVLTPNTAGSPHPVASS